jgi:hypothetical protein
LLLNYLLKHGEAIVNLQANSGATALFSASTNGHTNIVWERLKDNPCEARTGGIANRQADSSRYLVEHCPNKTRREDKRNATKRLDLKEYCATKETS